MILGKSSLFTATIALLACAPFTLFAQEEDMLVAQIRTDLLRDSRTASMSNTEIDALVSALALRAAEEGTVGDYLDSQNTFDYSSLFSTGTSKATSFFLPPLFIGLLSLAAILLAVGIYVVRNQGKVRGELSDSTL